VPGSYHYDVINHQLDILDLLYPNENDIPLFTKYSWMKDAKGVILISSVFNRSVKKYGSRGYRYILLEAGHVGQNICLAAAERNLSVRPMGGINEEYFENILSFDISRDRIIYALTF
jgi:SagB-type dehydrogenase family enzyme